MTLKWYEHGWGLVVGLILCVAAIVAVFVVPLLVVVLVH